MSISAKLILINFIIFEFTPRSTYVDDEGGNVKVNLTSKSKTVRDDELQLRLGLFLENNHSHTRTKHKQSLSSLGSNNTSPLSTLTNSSEADMSRGSMLPKAKHGCESIASLLSVSISEHSNASSNSLGRRHSLTGKILTKKIKSKNHLKIFF